MSNESIDEKEQLVNKTKKEKVKLIYRENNIDDTLSPIDLTKEYEDFHVTMFITECEDFISPHHFKNKEK
jgi:hypothetical protein